jgi:hypothetical protein
MSKILIEDSNGERAIKGESIVAVELSNVEFNVFIKVTCITKGLMFIVTLNFKSNQEAKALATYARLHQYV